MFTVYVIQSERHHRFYTGSTGDLSVRLDEHNSGKTVSTRHGCPWTLVHNEDFESRVEAIRREKQIKARGVARYLSDLKTRGVAQPG